MYILFWSQALGEECTEQSSPPEHWAPIARGPFLAGKQTAVVLNLGAMGHFGPRSKFWKKSRSQIWGVEGTSEPNMGVPKAPSEPNLGCRRYVGAKFQSAESKALWLGAKFWTTKVECTAFFSVAGKNIKVKRKPGGYAPDFYFCFIFEKICLKIVFLLEIFHYIN